MAFLVREGVTDCDLRLDDAVRVLVPELLLDLVGLPLLLLRYAFDGVADRLLLAAAVLLDVPVGEAAIVPLFELAVDRVPVPLTDADDVPVGIPLADAEAETGLDSEAVTVGVADGAVDEAPVPLCDAAGVTLTLALLVTNTGAVAVWVNVAAAEAVIEEVATTLAESEAVTVGDTVLAGLAGRLPLAVLVALVLADGVTVASAVAAAAALLKSSGIHRTAHCALPAYQLPRVNGRS